MMPSQHRRFKFIRGFTLIEVMVVVAIIGILAAIALPSYTDYIRKSKRADGIAAILSLQLAQEKFRANCIQYATKRVDSPNLCDKVNDKYEVEHLDTSSDERYKLQIASVSGISFDIAYEITATPQGNQTNDSCGNFILEVDGGTVEKSTSVYTDPDSSEARRCWAH